MTEPAGLLVKGRRALLHQARRVERGIEIIHRHHDADAGAGQLAHEIEHRHFVPPEQFPGALRVVVEQVSRFDGSHDQVQQLERTVEFARNDLPVVAHARPPRLVAVGLKPPRDCG